MNIRFPSSPRVGRSKAFRRWAAAAVILLPCCGGCDRQVDTEYATVRGTSINGVSAFVQLLRDTGHPTTARQTIPRRIGAAVRTVLVVDDSLYGLCPEAKDVIHRWITQDGPRTVLLVLRDSDATIGYLREILADGDLPDERRNPALALLDRAVQTLNAATADPRSATPPFPDGLVPIVRTSTTSTLEVRLKGKAAADDSIAARWELRRRLQTQSSDQTLWESGPDRLLIRRQIVDVEVLVLASAAPLLNGGFVDVGNRRLAEQLADLLPADGEVLLAGSSRVASGNGGGDGEGRDEEDDESSLLRLLTVQPLPWLAAQAVTAMGLFCWSMAPIFGRPRRASPTQAQNFGHHVDALASLFTRSPAAGAAFSRSRLEEWNRASPAPIAKSRLRVKR